MKSTPLIITSLLLSLYAFAIPGVPTCPPVALGLCPAAVVPRVTFDSTGGRAVSAKTAPCCPSQFLQCQIRNNVPYCRDMLYYTITPAQGNNVEVCPPTTPDCTCQQLLAGTKDMLLNFCPTPKNCCPTCQCYGDPHCTSFSQQQSVWAICDDRDANCDHSAANCRMTFYDGQACVWNNQQSICQQAPGTPLATMDMYSKNYYSYFDPSDETLYSFSTILTLGLYGSIQKIQITDAGTTYTFEINSNGKCVSDPKYPLRNGKVDISNLPSGVEFSMTCFQGKQLAGQRWDINSLVDPWFTKPAPSWKGFEGVCANGTIVETLGRTDSIFGKCNAIDGPQTEEVNADVASGLGINPTNGQTLSDLKKKWCDLNYKKLIFGTKQGCYDFVLAKAGNFLAAICSTSKVVVGNKKNLKEDPTTCYADLSGPCAQCVTLLKDYPKDALRILKGPRIGLTPPPTSACSKNLLTSGLNRKKLSTIQSGIQIDYQANGTTTWTPVFAVLDTEISQCGGCSNTLVVAGTVAANQVLLAPGTYRMKQCEGLNTSPTQDLCVAVPEYNSTVLYSNPVDGPAVSIPYGELWSAGDIRCVPSKYPNCPTNYSCCVWPHGTNAWIFCMVQNYGSDYWLKYPKC